MRIAILADIHGNAAALNAVLLAATRERADILCIAGDLVGYYYDPADVLLLLQAWEKYVIRGNHEDMLQRVVTDPEFRQKCLDKYGKGLETALDMLSTSQLDYLNALPATLRMDWDGVKVLMAHGAPWDTNHYIYPDAPDEIWERLADSDADVLILGHTHYRMVKKIGNTCVINPGSVGQPRDGVAGAAWALFDTADAKVYQFSEKYDVTEIQNKAKAIDSALPYLHEIFDRR